MTECMCQTRKMTAKILNHFTAKSIVKINSPYHQCRLNDTTFDAEQKIYNNLIQYTKQKIVLS